MKVDRQSSDGLYRRRSLKRPDLFDLIGDSLGMGLRTNVTPSASPLLTEEAIDRFKNGAYGD